MREKRSRSKSGAAGLLSILFAALAGATVVIAPGSTESAIANGDTRTIRFYHAHTHESISATFLVDGQYDSSVLEQLNWFLRDWRREEATKMDPRLFDVIWEVYRESGSSQPIEVMSAYRSPQTNAMLRHRSRGVAEHSQHILGKAMDQHYMDVPMSRIREIAMRLQRGGVGFYPTSGTPFVHMDVGGVRHWPRMSYDQLARLFPDGKTVHIPSNGQPLPGYEQARAELEARGDSFSYPTVAEVKSKGFFAWLFGGGDEEGDTAANDVGSRRPQTKMAALDRTQAGNAPAQYFGGQGKDAGAHEFALGAASSGFFGNSARQSVAQRPSPPPVQEASLDHARQPPPSDAQAEALLGRAMADGRQKEAGIQPVSSPVEPAASTPAEAAVAAAVPAESKPNQPSFVPMPPRRPVELASAGPEAPLPPDRPADPATSTISRSDRAPGVNTPKKDPIGALISTTLPSRTAALPAAIIQGPGAAKLPKAPQVLAFAGLGAPMPQPHETPPLPVARPPQLIAARLDRSNFRSLTGSGAAARVVHSSLGPTVTALRPAAQARLGAMAGQASPVAQAFGAAATELPSDHFSDAPVRRRDRSTSNSSGG